MYAYSAADSGGKIAKGEREAESDLALARALKAEGMTLLEARIGLRAQARASANWDVGYWLMRLRPVSRAEKMFFARNLSVMIAAGLSLTRALDALGAEATNPKFKKVVADVNAAVAKGSTFADALRRHQAIFGDLFVSMAEVGEATGKLTLVLKLVANQMKRDGTLVRRVRGAMMYPAIIVVVLIAVGTLMMIYVIPTLSATIKDLGVALPLSTRIIIGLSDSFVAYGLWIGLGFVALAVGAAYLYRVSAVRAMIGRWSLRVPVFGGLIKKLNTARFCRTLAYLTSAGVPIIRSLDITAGVVSNIRFREAAREAGREIQKGAPLHTILAGHEDIFPPLVTQMIAVGEETGKISDLLIRVALFFEEEVASITKNLSAVIEPILMVVIGVIVGIFAISVLQPIYTSLGNIGI